MIPVSEKSKNRKSYFFWVRLLLTLVILVLIFLRVDVRGIGDAFRSMHIPTFLFALMLLPVNLFLQIYRWSFILHTARIPVSVKDVSKSILVGLTLGLITPGRIGEVGRALHIRSSSTIQIAGLILFEKIFSLFTVLITSAISIMLWGNTIAGIVIIACTLFVVFHLTLIRPVLSRLSFLLPYGDRVAELWSKWSCFDRKKTASLLAITICFFLIVYLQLFVLVSSFQTVDISSALICMPLIIAINSIPITIAGLGLREGAAVFFLSRFGVAEASALNGALLLFALDLIIPGVFGLLLILKKRREQTGISGDQSS